MNQKFKSAASDLLFIVMTILIAILAVSGLVSLVKKYSANKAPAAQVTPAVDSLTPITDTAKPTPEEPKADVQEFTLIKPSDNYIVTGNPYLAANYKKYAKRLALIGDFDSAAIRAKISLPSTENHFLLVNLGDESGVYHGVRKQGGLLDVNKTIERGGAFSSARPIDLAIDLLKPVQLATTGPEFASKGGEKEVVLWDELKPPAPAPSVNTILFFPYNTSGAFTGDVESLTFEYACKAGSSCAAAQCSPNELTTVCLKREFGIEAAREWCAKTNEDGCQNLK